MHASTIYPLLYGFDAPLLHVLLPLLVVAALWTITLKGFALWFAASGGQKWWFIALLIVNTLGVLEIIYLIWFRAQEPHARSSTTSSSVQ